MAGVPLIPLYIAYHDEEWGKPEHDETWLFEMLCLEGQQAGLSWIVLTALAVLNIRVDSRLQRLSRLSLC